MKGFIPWCGLLLKTSTLEVQADYSRYLGEDFRLRDSFTVEASRAVGSTLRRRLYSFLRPKCHGVLLDTRINSLPTVWLNVYQSFLLAAIKFHCYTRALPQRHLNVQFFTRCASRVSAADTP
jgi:telomerase reverse transcriptase